MKVKNGHIIYFIGIGGIGMSALARWCNNLGATIFGYDLTPTILTKKLEDEGMTIHYESDIKNVPEKVDFAIYTPAIPKDNPELVYIKEKGIPLLKRSEFLGEISNDYKTIAVAGTHGKTSITAQIAHILKHSNFNVSAFVGGITNNYGTNLILSDKTDYLVVEADEFDRSMLKLSPDIAIITSTDRDHLDIYSDHDDIKNTFLEFANCIKENGTLIYNSKTGPFDEISRQKLNYSTIHDASAIASNIRIANGSYLVDIRLREMLLENVEINVPGIHNIENTLAAVTASYLVGVESEDIKKGIESFKGVERRMEYIINAEDIVFIDDYAHHPEEVRNTIETVRSLYPKSRIVGVFQPHLYTRTRDFAEEFAQELSKVDELWLLDIYPAREKPIEGVTSEIIAKRINNIPVKVIDKKDLLNLIAHGSQEVLLTMGAGDIGALIEDIKEALLKK
jgi:UDP-N-acetylmuramate--alanine ligase